MSAYNQGNTDHNRKGDHVFVCDICGQKTWQSDSKVTWNGFLACISRGCWYPKHPADEPLPVINDPVTLPAQIIRTSPEWDNLPVLASTGVSTWSQILPPYNVLTYSQINLHWSTFDDGTSWFTNDQQGP